MGLLIACGMMWALGLGLIGRGVDALWGDGWASLAVGVYSGLSSVIFFLRIRFYLKARS